MQPVGTSSTIGGSSETHGIAASSDGTFERENSSDNLYHEVVNLK